MRFQFVVALIGALFSSMPAQAENTVPPPMLQEF